ncbi:MAG: hypothetical protein ACXW1D_04970 [Halobacteriota archaeon]
MKSYGEEVYESEIILFKEWVRVSLGTKIRDLRISKGLTQLELGGRFSLPQHDLAN